MSVFVEFGHCRIYGRETVSEEPVTVYVCAAHIVEVCQIQAHARLKDNISKEEYDARDKESKDYSAPGVREHFRYIDTVSIYLADGTPLKAPGIAAEIAAQIEKAIEDHAIEQALAIEKAKQGALALTDRGEWTPDETYHQLDVVTDPADSTLRYIGVATSKSASKSVLLDKGFWCRLGHA